MKYFEKFILVVFSVIIIIESILLILYSTEMINIKPVLDKIVELMLLNKTVTIVIGAILALFGLVGIITPGENSENMKTGLAIKP